MYTKHGVEESGVSAQHVSVRAEATRETVPSIPGEHGLRCQQAIWSILNKTCPSYGIFRVTVSLTADCCRFKAIILASFAKAAVSRCAWDLSSNLRRARITATL